MGMVGILVGSGWLLRELGVLFGPEPQESPRRCMQRRGESSLFGGGLLALGVLHQCNPQPWLPYLMGVLLVGALIECVLCRLP